MSAGGTATTTVARYGELAIGDGLRDREAGASHRRFCNSDSDERDRVSVLDIAPMLFYLADQPIPDDLPGTLRTDWIEPAVLEAKPPREIRASEFPSLPEGPEVESVEDPELTERLRALGYVE